MIEFIKRKLGVAMLFLLWALTGMYINDTVALGLVAITILLFKVKTRYDDLIFGFILVLVLSDNRNYAMEWTRNTKNLYIVLLSVFYLLDKKQFTQPNKLFIPFIPMFLWAAALVIRSPEISICAQKTLSYILLFVCVPPYFTKLILEKGETFLRDIIMFTSWILLLGLLLVPIIPDNVLLEGRFMGLLGNPNGTGTLATVLFFLFYIVQKKYPYLFVRNEKYFFYILIAVSLLFSASRNAMLSIGVFLFFSRFYRISPLIGIFSIIVIGISYQLVTDNLSEILHVVGMDKLMRAETIKDGSGRFVAWAFAWQHIQQNFFVGRGFDYDVNLFTEYQPYLNTLGHLGGVHNCTFGFWLTLGLIGVIFYYGALIHTFIKASKFNTYAMPMLFAVILSTNFEAWLMGSLNPFTIFFLLTIIVLYYDHQQSTKEPA